jgi:hypothetical protein
MHHLQQQTSPLPTAPSSSPSRFFFPWRKSNDGFVITNLWTKKFRSKKREIKTTNPHTPTRDVSEDEPHGVEGYHWRDSRTSDVLERSSANGTQARMFLCLQLFSVPSATSYQIVPNTALVSHSKLWPFSPQPADTFSPPSLSLSRSRFLSACVWVSLSLSPSLSLSLLFCEW